MTVTPRKKKPIYAGLTISHRVIELAVFSPKTFAIEQSYALQVPEGLFDSERDVVRDPAMLKELIAQVLGAARPRPTMLHVSLPGTLLRMVEMPKVDPASLYVSLSSEAERYKTFDNTEAAVDFVTIDNAALPANLQQLVLGAVRSDAIALYLKIFKELRVKAYSIGLEPLNILRGMAGTGVLDSLVQQVGTDARWGMIFVEPYRVRFTLWQCDRLLELRELSMDTSEFVHATETSLVVEDMREEIRRTTKNEQPALWLTSNMPPAMENILSNMLGCPVRTAPLGDGIAMQQPVQLATVGCSMTSLVAFPFDLDITEGLKAGAGSGAIADATTDSDSGNDALPAWLLLGGAASVLLGAVVSAGLFLFADVTAKQVPEWETKVQGAQVEVEGLQARLAVLNKKAELDQTLLDVVQKAKIRNHVYVALTEDLKRKTPEQVWIQVLRVEEGLKLTGKALNHKSVINFAKSFDAAPYTKAVLIDSIKEGKLGGRIIYDFQISGGVNLDKSILPGNADGSGDKKSDPKAGQVGA